MIKSSNRNRTKWTGCPDTFSSIAKGNDEFKWTLIPVHFKEWLVGRWEFLLYHSDFNIRIICECIHLISYHLDYKCIHLYFFIQDSFEILSCCFCPFYLRLSDFSFIILKENFNNHIFEFFQEFQYSVFFNHFCPVQLSCKRYLISSGQISQFVSRLFASRMSSFFVVLFVSRLFISYFFWLLEILRINKTT